MSGRLSNQAKVGLAVNGSDQQGLRGACRLGRFRVREAKRGHTNARASLALSGLLCQRPIVVHTVRVHALPAQAPASCASWHGQAPPPAASLVGRWACHCASIAYGVLCAEGRKGSQG